MDTETLSLVFFLIFGVVAVIGAAFVILNRNPVYCALNLVMTLFAVSALYILLGAYFVAAVQVIVYAGAIVVLFLFVIMLLNLGNQEALHEAFNFRTALGMILGAVLVAVVGVVAWNSVSGSPATLDATFNEVSHTGQIGRLLYQNYLLPFEVASVILLAALVGVVVLIRFHGRAGRE